MKKLSIQSAIGNSEIIIGESFTNILNYIPSGKKTAIITDVNVRKIYGGQFPKGIELIEIGTGETIKNLDTVKYIIGRLIEMEFDRSSHILGIGGGIVCDITGFVASVFMRGVHFSFISTTLLSQVDASVGGKNGVNFDMLKNMVGVFNLPEYVICDINMLNTLPKEEVLCGMGEIVKHGAIASPRLFDYIEKNIEKAKNLDREVIETFVYESVAIKSEIVNRDAKEKGDRKKLNFGHTFGHAIEKISGIPHGQAVSIGMNVAAGLSVQKGLLTKDEHSRLLKVLTSLGLPVKPQIDPQKAIDAMKRDKKREGDIIHFILLESIGKAVIKEISYSELESIVINL